MVIATYKNEPRLFTNRDCFRNNRLARSCCHYLYRTAPEPKHSRLLGERHRIRPEDGNRRARDGHCSKPYSNAITNTCSYVNTNPHANTDTGTSIPAVVDLEPINW